MKSVFDFVKSNLVSIATFVKVPNFDKGICNLSLDENSGIQPITTRESFFPTP